ncbi:unnamed protein product [Cuscuta europaea]|uniref:DUF4408 domain-containing protein n=1 Tax=Cuscuta europaea TaxID=41803 RepID=A0A9P1E4F7_CUSEU|nr:unnamed protein product [Cuscuta europaea]
MDLGVFDVVKSEKAKAVARFNRFRRMMKMIKCFELIVVLMVISWSCTRIPAVVKLTGVCLVELWDYACNPHVVFVIGNAIIVSLFVLCRKTGVSCNSVVFDFCVDDGDEISSGASQSPMHSSEESALPHHSEAAEEETKQIVCSESATQIPQCNEISAAMKMAEKQIEKFRRTQSESLKRAMALKPGRELRRSATEVRREVPNFNGKRVVPTVEDLNNEEFRLRIEKFIRQNQQLFQIENGLRT